MLLHGFRTRCSASCDFLLCDFTFSEKFDFHVRVNSFMYYAYITTTERWVLTAFGGTFHVYINSIFFKLHGTDQCSWSCACLILILDFGPDFPEQISPERQKFKVRVPDQCHDHVHVWFLFLTLDLISLNKFLQNDRNSKSVYRINVMIMCMSDFYSWLWTWFPWTNFSRKSKWNIGVQDVM